MFNWIILVLYTIYIYIPDEFQMFNINTYKIILALFKKPNISLKCLILTDWLKVNLMLLWINNFPFQIYSALSKHYKCQNITTLLLLILSHYQVIWYCKHGHFCTINFFACGRTWPILHAFKFGTCAFLVYAHFEFLHIS